MFFISIMAMNELSEPIDERTLYFSDDLLTYMKLYKQVILLSDGLYSIIETRFKRHVFKDDDAYIETVNRFFDDLYGKHIRSIEGCMLNEIGLLLSDRVYEIIDSEKGK